MPRFFFHIDYGEKTEDRDGTELPGLMAARNAAVQLLCELLSDKADEFWAKPDITITVTNDVGLALWSVSTMGFASAAVGQRKG